MSIVRFNIRYQAQWGEEICVLGHAGDIASWTPEQPLVMQCTQNDRWSLQVEISDFADCMNYRYALRRRDGSWREECGPDRKAVLHARQELQLDDYWQDSDTEDIFMTKAFTDSLFKRRQPTPAADPGEAPDGQVQVVWRLRMPQIEPYQGLAILGNIPELGAWDKDRMVPLDDEEHPYWQVKLHLPKHTRGIEYKYLVYDLESRNVFDFEAGENRRLDILCENGRLTVNDFDFRHSQARWRGAGTAIPIFSLRSEESFGIGEFQDLKKLAQWAAKTKQRIIQTLPVNDTTLQHNRRDSYPYNCLSVFALNPIYLNIGQMGGLSPAKLKEYRREQAELNALDIADYERVAQAKDKYFRLIYRRDKEKVFDSDDYRQFFDRNRSWLVPYAVFCYLRDKNGTSCFRTWKRHSVYERQEAEAMCRPDFKDYDKVAYHLFLQYHLDRQLHDAVAYAHSLGIAIKGDIPIGISPDSVDAWCAPELFHLDASAGAPPDDFSISGQNWGFPTYDWQAMAADGYGWWRRRFSKMEDCFDAYRIDHILGFFRIWEMPKTDVWGLCGRFSPALPYSLDELVQYGIQLDWDRLTKPYIRGHFLGEIFGEQTEAVKRTFLDTQDDEVFRFKPEFDTQRKVKAWFSGHTQFGESVRDGLYLLHSEVLMVPDLRQEDRLHPRILLRRSHSFKELPEHLQQTFAWLHDDFFYSRHNTFWKESAMSKLPALTGATRMLVCGEDLGMVPQCVPEVMKELEILSLEIQRMPKEIDCEFGQLHRLPYLSVCTTGTHDMNPLRAWWEEDPEKTARYYTQVLAGPGQAPEHCQPAVVGEIIRQHLSSPAMWVILPWQDWTALDEASAKADLHSERINVPVDTRNYWCYRMHLSLESLLENDSLNNRITRLIAHCGR